MLLFVVQSLGESSYCLGLHVQTLVVLSVGRVGFERPAEPLVHGLGDAGLLVLGGLTRKGGYLVVVEGVDVLDVEVWAFEIKVLRCLREVEVELCQKTSHFIINYN